jgi:tetratricopeptide (TPR) repeat protein
MRRRCRGGGRLTRRLATAFRRLLASRALKPSHKGPSATPTLSPGRRRLFRLVLLVLVLVVPLGALELGLRLAGYGFETEFLLERTINGRRVFTDNPRFAYRFFPPRIARAPQTLLVDVEKPADTIRVVVLGESAALGDPEPAFGLPRHLGVVLPARFPGKKFEVINVAMTAINSHAFPDIARSATRLKADFWVIYAGNNEFMGPFGPASIGGGAGRTRWLIRTGLVLQRTRTGQWLAALGTRLTGKPGASDAEWAGLETFLSQQLSPNDPKLADAYASFRVNLATVLDLAKAAGTTAVLAAPAVNLRDSAPFASAGTNLEAELKEITTLPAGDALQRLEALTTREPNHAAVWYLLGRARLQARNTNAAVAAFTEARDKDALKFRADSKLIAVARELASSRTTDGVVALDAEASFAARAPGGAPGNETFWEHVHFNFDGNLRLANLVAEALAGKLGTIAGPPATRDLVARELAYTEWNEARVVELIRQRISRPPFNQRGNAAEQELMISREVNRLRPAVQITAFEKHAAVYREALAKRTNDWMLRDQFARLLSSFGDRDSAIEEWRAVVAQVPHHLTAHYQLGDALSLSPTNAVEAEQHLRAALALRADFAEAWDRLGQALGQQKKFTEAEAAFVRAVELRPAFAEARVNRALVLALAGQTNAALGVLREAATRDTNSALAWQQLGRLLGAAGQSADAAAALEQVARLRPQQFAARYQVAEAWQRAGRADLAAPHWLEAVTLNPESAEARYFLALELARGRQFEEAAAQFREVIQRRPELASAHLNLGVALMQLQRPEEALTAFDKAVELEPANQQARTYAKSVRERLLRDGK